MTEAKYSKTLIEGGYITRLTVEDVTTSIFCSSWQWWLDFDSPNPERRKVDLMWRKIKSWRPSKALIWQWSRKSVWLPSRLIHAIRIERPGGWERYYHRPTLSSRRRLMRVCEQYSWGHKFASDTCYRFNRKGIGNS